MNINVLIKYILFISYSILNNIFQLDFDGKYPDILIYKIYVLKFLDWKINLLFSILKEEEDDYEDESGSNSESESDTSSNGFARNANTSSSTNHSTKPNNVDSSHKNIDSSGWHRTG